MTLAPDRLAISVVHADGRVTRWAGDEPDGAAVARGLKFSTSIPGGFKDCSASLARRVDVDYPDLELFDHVHVYGPGGEVAWEGRQQQFPRQHGSDFAIEVGAVGWWAHLADDASFREIYVDRDPSHWQQMSLEMRALLVAAGAPVDADYRSSADSTGLRFTGITGKAVPINSRTDLLYECPAGLTAQTIHYRGTQANTTSITAPTLYGDSVSSFTGPVTAALTLDNTTRTATLAGARRFLALIAHASAGHTPTSQFTRTYDQIAVYGAHGLTLRAISGEPSGLFASDVIADIVARTAPKLTFTTGSAGSIQPTDFAIPQIAFADPTKGVDAILRVNAYHLFDPAVWDRRTFHYRPSDPTADTLWEARLSDGAQVSLEGDQAGDLFNGVVVSFRDPLGAQRTVGPPGSATDAQSSALVSADPDHPANLAGIDRWETISLTVPTTIAGAIQLGAVWLAEHSLPQRRGQIVLQGKATCVRSGWRSVPLGDGPAWRPRAGDFVRIADHPSSAPRKIIHTDYAHDPRTNTLSVGSTPFKLEAIIERIASQLFGL